MIKTNFQIYKYNDKKFNKTLPKSQMKLYINNEFSLNQSLPKKKVIITSLNNDIKKFNIRKELTKKLLSTERDSYTYKNNMNRENSPFHKTFTNFNLNLFSNVKKKSYIKSLFKNFLISLKDKFNSIYNDFENYFDLFINENEVIKNSDLYQYDIFKSVIEKFFKKNLISKDDITLNNTNLNVLEQLLKDYIHLLTKNTSSNCSKFISIFLHYYKKILLANYEIFSDKISSKEDEIKNLRDTINLYKERINNFEYIQYDKKEEQKKFETIKLNFENIIEDQALDIENLRAKINELEGQISIKEYKIKMLSNKQEERKLNFNIREENFNIYDEFEEKLEYEYLLKGRLERIRFKKFKNNIQNKNLLDKKK